MGRQCGAGASSSLDLPVLLLLLVMRQAITTSSDDVSYARSHYMHQQQGTCHKEQRISNPMYIQDRCIHGGGAVKKDYLAQLSRYSQVRDILAEQDAAASSSSQDCGIREHYCVLRNAGTITAPQIEDEEQDPLQPRVGQHDMMMMMMMMKRKRRGVVMMMMRWKKVE